MTGGPPRPHFAADFAFSGTGPIAGFSSAAFTSCPGAGAATAVPSTTAVSPARRRAQPLRAGRTPALRGDDRLLRRARTRGRGGLRGSRHPRGVHERDRRGLGGRALAALLRVHPRAPVARRSRGRDGRGRRLLRGLRERLGELLVARVHAVTLELGALPQRVPIGGDVREPLLRAGEPLVRGVEPILQRVVLGEAHLRCVARARREHVRLALGHRLASVPGRERPHLPAVVLAGDALLHEPRLAILRPGRRGPGARPELLAQLPGNFSVRRTQHPSRCTIFTDEHPPIDAASTIAIRAFMCAPHRRPQRAAGHQLREPLGERAPPGSG